MGKNEQTNGVIEEGKEGTKGEREEEQEGGQKEEEGWKKRDQSLFL